jgi:hypothetical protein
LLLDAAIEAVAYDRGRKLEAVLTAAKAAERSGKFGTEHDPAELVIISELRAAEGAAGRLGAGIAKEGNRDFVKARGTSPSAAGMGADVESGP